MRLTEAQLLYLAMCRDNPGRHSWAGPITMMWRKLQRMGLLDHRPDGSSTGLFFLNAAGRAALSSEEAGK